MMIPSISPSSTIGLPAMAVAPVSMTTVAQPYNYLPVSGYAQNASAAGIDPAAMYNIILQLQAPQAAPASQVNPQDLVMILALMELLNQQPAAAYPPSETPPPPAPAAPKPEPKPAPKPEPKPKDKGKDWGKGLMNLAKTYFMGNSDYAAAMPIIDILTGNDSSSSSGDSEDKNPIQKLLSGAFMAHVADAAIRGVKTPLVFDLDGNGVSTSDRKTRFDIDADGALDEISDIADGDGLLTIDTNGNGLAGEDGSEVLGNATDLDGDGKADGFKDGFDALKGLAVKAQQDGLINGDDVLDADELKTLATTYGLSMKVGSLNSKAQSLADSGISSINLSTGEKTFVSNFDGRANSTLKQAGASFTRVDGSRGDYEDVHFK